MPQRRGTTPEPPAWLNADQRKRWLHTVKELADADIESVGVDLITAYVTTMDMLQRSSEIVAREGLTITAPNGAKVRHPATIVHAQSVRLVDRMAARLGL